MGRVEKFKRLTCDRCGKKGHPLDRCLFVCRGCGETYDVGKCQMKDVYNLIRQWYNPTKHAVMLPDEGRDDEKLV